MACTFIVAYVFCIILGLFIYALMRINKSHTFWKKKGVSQIDPEFFFGNIKQVILRKKAWGQTFLEFYKEFKHMGLKYGGVYFFTKPTFVPVDPELIKNIMLKDFDYFTDHGVYVNEEAEPLTGHLFNLEGAKWKALRAKLTPTFTSGKMKMMYQTFVSCTEGLKEMVNEYSSKECPVDIKEILARFTTDIIGSCAFGVECNSMKNPESEFRIYGRKIFERDWLTTFNSVASQLLPKDVCTFLGVKVINPQVTRFFMKMVKDTVEYREKNNVFRKDFMHLLLQLKNQGNVTDDETVIHQNGNGKSAINLNELSAQCFVFFLAGYETSSTAMTFALYELAANQDVQETLRKEINDVLEKHDRKLTYNAIMEMSYLEKVIYEALRKYPPVPGTIRVCNKNYKLPDSDLILEKNTRIHIPILGIHMDPEYYPNPDKFDPERFNENAKSLRPAFTWLPFGEGPRMCIGLRFGMLQSKVGLATIIKHFKISVSEKTKVPLEMDPDSFINSVKGKVWINIETI